MRDDFFEMDVVVEGGGGGVGQCVCGFDDEVGVVGGDFRFVAGEGEGFGGGEGEFVGEVGELDHEGVDFMEAVGAFVKDAQGKVEFGGGEHWETLNFKFLTSRKRGVRDAEESKHSSGLAFFEAVGVVLGEVRGGVEFAVVEVLDAELAGLCGDGGGEVGFVIGRANAGGDDDGEVLGAGAVVAVHDGDRFSEDVEFGAFFSGVEQADGFRYGVGKVDRGAIGDVDGEQSSGEIGDESVHARMGGGRDVGGDDLDLPTVDLFGVVTVVVWESAGDDPFVVWGEVIKCEVTLAEDVDMGDSRDPGGKENAEIVDGAKKVGHFGSLREVKHEWRKTRMPPLQGP